MTDCNEMWKGRIYDNFKAQAIQMHFLTELKKKKKQTTTQQSLQERPFNQAETDKTNYCKNKTVFIQLRAGIHPMI